MKELRTHKHPYRGREYLHTKYEKPDGSTTWLWSRWQDDLQIFGLDGVALPLWRHERLAAADASAIVLLPEGEKDVEAGERLGFLATTTPSGALWGKKRWLPLYTKALARFDHVVVLEDNDDTGREHARRCASALHGLIADLRVIRLPGLPEKGDLSDWVAAGHTADELRALIAAAPQWAPPAWPEPIPLTEVSGLPDFPTHLLPGWLREHVEAVAAETLTPRAVPAMIDLAVLSAVLARKVAIHVRDNWTEPLNIYAVVVAEPSTLKTPVFKMACAPLEIHERAQADAIKPAITEAENKKANLHALLEAARKKAGRAEDERERKSLLKQTEDLSRELDALVVPRAPQLIATDVTEESLGELLSQNNGRIAVMSDEGGPIRNMAGRYTAKGAPVFELFKHGHNAGTVRINRRGHEPYLVPLAAITAGLMVQPSFLRGLKDVPEFRGEGLLARFLYALPDSLGGKRDWSTAVGVPPRASAQYRERLMALLKIPFGSDEHGACVPHVMELSPEARDLVVPFRNELEPRLARGGDLRPIMDWAGKLTGEAVRIAALLHLAEHADTPEPWSVEVTSGAMSAALSIAREFLIPHAAGAFTTMGGGPEFELAVVALDWIRKQGAPRISRRDLYRARKSHVKEPKEFDGPLALLEDYGWLRAVERPKAKGRPSEQYDVNPAVFGGALPAEHGDAWEGPDDGYES